MVKKAQEELGRGMKFTVDSGLLNDALHWVSRSLSTRPTNSALHGIVIEAGKEVHLSATDLETSAKSHFSADIQNQGKVLVPGKLLSDIARALPNKSVTFNLEGNRVQVTAGKSKFQLPIIPNSEYPTLPTVPEESGTINTSLFTEAITQVAIAASKDDSLPKLTGIHIEVNEEKITLAATDRYRLAVRELAQRNGLCRSNHLDTTVKKRKKKSDTGTSTTMAIQQSVTKVAAVKTAAPSTEKESTEKEKKSSPSQTATKSTYICKTEG